MLATFGGTGIVLSILLDWTSLSRPWSFLLGFLMGILSGMGAALSIYGLGKRRD